MLRKGGFDNIVEEFGYVCLDLVNARKVHIAKFGDKPICFPILISLLTGNYANTMNPNFLRRIVNLLDSLTDEKQSAEARLTWILKNAPREKTLYEVLEGKFKYKKADSEEWAVVTPKKKEPKNASSKPRRRSKKKVSKDLLSVPLLKEAGFDTKALNNPSAFNKWDVVQKALE